MSPGCRPSRSIFSSLRAFLGKIVTATSCTAMTYGVATKNAATPSPTFRAVIENQTEIPKRPAHAGQENERNHDEARYVDQRDERQDLLKAQFAVGRFNDGRNRRMFVVLRLWQVAAATGALGMPSAGFAARYPIAMTWLSTRYATTTPQTVRQLQGTTCFRGGTSGRIRAPVTTWSSTQRNAASMPVKTARMSSERAMRGGVI